VATVRSLPLARPTPLRGAGLADRARELATDLGPLLVGLLLVAPLVMLTVNSFNVAPVGQPARYGLANWAAALADPSALGALANSLELSLVRTSISLPVAIALTWLVTRTDMPGRSLVELVCWL
jgi:iron(III) transport system permease protein